MNAGMPALASIPKAPPRTPRRHGMPQVRIMLGIFFATVMLNQDACAATPWRARSNTEWQGGFLLPNRITVCAEQAFLPTESLGRMRRYGYGGPTNLHTRKLSFVHQGTTYAVPEPYATDLLRLHITRGGATSPYALKATRHPEGITFMLRGADGEKGYTAYFRFRDGKFFQRILSYGESRTIFIHTAER